MIFYLVPATADKPAVLMPTQGAAFTESRLRGLKIQSRDMKHDVPTNQKGLQAYINGMLAKEHGLMDEPLPTLSEFAPERAAPDPAIAEERRQQDTMLMRQAYTALDIEEFILTKASIAQVGQIFSCIGSRFAELVKGAPQS